MHEKPADKKPHTSYWNFVYVGDRRQSKQGNTHNHISVFFCVVVLLYSWCGCLQLKRGGVIINFVRLKRSPHTSENVRTAQPSASDTPTSVSGVLLKSNSRSTIDTHTHTMSRSGVCGFIIQMSSIPIDKLSAQLRRPSHKKNDHRLSA